MTMRVDERESRIPGEWVRGAILFVTLVASCLVFSFRNTSFNHPKELVTGIGLCILALSTLTCGPGVCRGFAAFLPLWLLVLFGALCHVVGGIAQVPSDTVVTLVRTGTLLLAPALCWDLLAREPWRLRLMVTIVLSATVAACLGLLQYLGWLDAMFPVFSGYPQRIYSVFGNQDLFGGYLSLAIPAAIHGLRHSRLARPVCSLSLPVLVTALLLSGSRSAWLAAAVGSAVAFAQIWPSRREMLLLAVCVMLPAIFVAGPAPDATVKRLAGTFSEEDVGGRARLWFWDGTAPMIGDHPLVGVGPGNYAYWSPSYMGEALKSTAGQRHYHNELLVEHPHSEPLLILAETGLVGAALVGWMLVRVSLHGGPEWAPLAALMCFSLFNAPFQCIPFGLTGILLVTSLLARRPLAEASQKGRQLCVGLAIVATFSFTAFHVWAVYIPSLRLRAAEEVHMDGGDPLRLYEACASHSWPNATAHLRYGLALAEAGKAEEAESQFKEALERMDTGEVYLLLATISAKRGRIDEARQWLGKCLERWPDNRSAMSLRRSLESGSSPE